MKLITNHLAIQIAARTIEASFKDEIEADRLTENDLGVRAYRSIFPAEVIRNALSLPNGWLRMDSCLRFNCEGWQCRLQIIDAVPVPSANYGCSQIGVISGELAEEIKSFMQDCDARKDARESATRTVFATVRRAHNFKKLAEIWPEGAVFYQDYAGQEPATAVALTFSDINKTLGLPLAA